MKQYKLGVVTFFDAYNYGALFQTYALQMFLKKNNISSCVVNYSWHPSEKANSIRELLYLIKHGKSIKRKKKSFASFLNRCSLSPEYNSTNICDANAICERFIVGSDQVWNSKWNYNSNVFYLTFADKKFSYAASFGSINSISSYRHKIIKDDLSLFNAISVRERSAVKYLENILTVS